MIRVLRNTGMQEGGGGASGAGPAEGSPQNNPSPSTTSSAVPQDVLGLKGMMQSFSGLAIEDQKEEQTDQTAEDKKADSSEVDESVWKEDIASFLKEKGFDSSKIEKNDQTEKLINALREKEQGFALSSEKETNALTRAQELEELLLSGSVEELQKAGYDFRAEIQTPEKRLESINEEWENFRSGWGEMLKEIDKRHPEGIPDTIIDTLKQAGDRFKQQYQIKADVYNEEIKTAQLEDRFAQKFGLNKGTGKEAVMGKFNKLKTQAQSNLTELVQKEKAGDANAEQYWSYISKATDIGGPLRALGIDLAKAFGASPKTAEFMYKAGKGMYILDNMPSILANERKNWEKEAALKSQGQGEPVGASPSSNPNNQQTNPLGALLRSYMGG